MCFSGTFYGGQLHRSDPLEGGLPAALLRHVDLLDELQAAQHVGDVVQPPHLGWNQEVRTEGQRRPTLTLHRFERRGDRPQVLSDVQIPNANEHSHSQGIEQMLLSKVTYNKTFFLKKISDISLWVQ